MSTVTDLLNSVAGRMSLTSDGGLDVPAAQPVHFSVVSPDKFPLTVPVLAPGDVSLTWIAKSVRFADPLPAPIVTDGMGNAQSLAASLSHYLVAANVIGGTPIANVQVPVEGPPLKGAIPPTTAIGIGISTIAGQVTPPTVVATPAPVADSPAALPNVPPQPPNAISPSDVLSGIPGLLGQIAGSIPVLVNTPVTFTVVWEVKKGDRVLVEGTDYLAPQGLTATSITLIFVPTFTEYGQESTSKVTVSATITLQALGETVPFTPPALTLTLLDLGIPRVLAAFRHTQFAPWDGSDAGFALVVVPQNYPFVDFNALSPVLTQLQTALSNVRTVAGIAGFLTGLGELLDAVPAQPSVQLHAGQINDLSDVNFETGLFSGNNPDDEISSAILIGVPGAAVQIANNDDFDGSDGMIVLTTGDQMWAALTSFVFNGQSDAEQFAQPDASVLRVNMFIDGYNDSAESVRFV